MSAARTLFDGFELLAFKFTNFGGYFQGCDSSIFWRSSHSPRTLQERQVFASGTFLHA